jgi:hypothetical protein
MGWYENTWKPVKLGDTKVSGRGFSGASYKASDWFNKLMINSGSRKNKLDRFDVMDTTVDISRALDVIAEDISSDGADDNKVFDFDFPEDFKSTKGQNKTIQDTMNLWMKRTELDYRFFDYCREMIKYGMIAFRMGKNGTLQKLIPHRIEGYKLSPDDDTLITHYVYNNTGAFRNENDDLVSGQGTKAEDKKELIPVEDLLIMKIGEGPYGESILDRVYRVWKQLQLLEDAIVIYRIVRAPERRVFYIDIGKMPVHKAEGYIEKVKNKIRQKQVVKNGEIETDYNPASMQEDYYIGTTGEGRGSKVETLPGGDNLGKIEDLQFFNKKLSLGLRIPPSYLDSYSEDVNGAQYNDGRVASAYIAEMRYVGYVKRIQKTIAKELFRNFKRFAKKSGVEIPEELDFIISPPQSFAIYKENELNSVLLTTYGSADGVESISKRFALRRYLNMDEEDLVANEDQKLMEKGLSPEQIKKLKQEERYNIVYGDGHLNPNVEVDEEGTKLIGGIPQD